MCECPKCGWYPPDNGGYYYCRKGKAIDCTKHSYSKPKHSYSKPVVNEAIDIIDDILQTVSVSEIQAGPYLYGKPPFKHLKCYPQVEGYQHSPYASYEFGIDGHSWVEVHKCPVCNKEFSFDNSDY